MQRNNHGKIKEEKKQLLDMSENKIECLCKTDFSNMPVICFQGFDKSSREEYYGIVLYQILFMFVFQGNSRIFQYKKAKQQLIRLESITKHLFWVAVIRSLHVLLASYFWIEMQPYQTRNGSSACQFPSLIFIKLNFKGHF